MPVPKCESIVAHEEKTGRPVACGLAAGQYVIFPLRKDAPTHLSAAGLTSWYNARCEMSCKAVLCDRHVKIARRQGKEVLAS